MDTGKVIRIIKNVPKVITIQIPSRTTKKKSNGQSIPDIRPNTDFPITHPIRKVDVEV